MNEIYFERSLTPEQEAQERLDRVFQNPALENLAVSFGFGGFQSTETSAKISELKDFTNANWDFRGGKERWEAESFEPTPEQSIEIFDIARNFGPYNMVDSTEPAHSSYDFVTILGAGNDGPLYRVRYAKEQLKKLSEMPRYMLLLGSARPVTPAERAKTDPYAPEAETEFDLMNAAVESEFDNLRLINDITSEEDDNRTLTAADKDYWRIRRYLTPEGMEIISVCAPQVEGERRVNTADTYRFMQEVMGKYLIEGKRILNVTHAIYTPFQDMDAHRMLGVPVGATIDTIGFEAGYAGIVRKPDQLVQEMNSAANSGYLLQLELHKKMES